mmetsp:Transcript_115046/g.245741  ORF Transcript_115046/g.245741 Transcript_115046/m.245741 type:complete len:285 (+) Transcript_115046:1352-2206(+)
MFAACSAAAGREAIVCGPGAELRSSHGLRTQRCACPRQSIGILGVDSRFARLGANRIISRLLLVALQAFPSASAAAHFIHAFLAELWAKLRGACGAPTDRFATPRPRCVTGVDALYALIQAHRVRGVLLKALQALLPAGGTTLLRGTGLILLGAERLRRGRARPKFFATPRLPVKLAGVGALLARFRATSPKLVLRIAGIASLATPLATLGLQAIAPDRRTRCGFEHGRVTRRGVLDMRLFRLIGDHHDCAHRQQGSHGAERDRKTRDALCRLGAVDEEARLLL